MKSILLMTIMIQMMKNMKTNEKIEQLFLKMTFK